MKVKVLFAADLLGNFAALDKQIPKFDLVFCVGKTLAPNEATAAVFNNTFKGFPVPVYFVDNGPLRHVLSAKYPHGGEISPNLFYLGGVGIQKIKGLQVGYVSGDYEYRKSRPRPNNINSILDALNLYEDSDIDKIISHVTADSEFKGLDVLLTCNWPKGYSQYLERLQMHPDISVQEFTGLEMISKFAYYCKPRYHVSAGHDFYFERIPYVNYDNYGKPAHTTRLICLGKCPQGSEKAKYKYLYAAGLAPIDTMESSVLHERPDSTTENPYFSLFLSQQHNDSINQHTDHHHLQSVEEIFKEDADLLPLPAAHIEKIDKLQTNVLLHVSGFNL
jgi:hypothetical protein